MLVYSGTKDSFCSDVWSNQIADKILSRIHELGLSGGSPAEYMSWQNSMGFMRNILEDSYFSGDIDVAIEYQIPRTSKRVDFMIGGSDENGNDNVVIVELKQWQRAEKLGDEMSHSVKAFTGGAERIVSHPSYQAFSYSVFIKNSSQEVEDKHIGVIPCAYLHNYDPSCLDSINDNIYKIWCDEAPFFIKNQVQDITDFIKKYICRKSKDGELLYRIDHGRIKPSKALQDCLVSLMQGNEEFILLDDQVVAFDMCKQIMFQCQKDRKKRVLVIQGGPGTGKSVLAVNLLKEFLVNDLNVSYVTKNKAPREAYLKKLTNFRFKDEVTVNSLFRSPFGLCHSPKNYYDCLIVDEAHRLVKKMYGDFDGENQVKECINASLFTIFLIDENQKVTTKDIGTIDEITKWANELGSNIKCTELSSQFRCNGSDEYIQFVNNVLQIGEHVDIDPSELNFDLEVFDNPSELREKLRSKNTNNKARMVAGYCYDWNVKYKRGDWDIVIGNDFRAKWNLEGDDIWAINPNSFDEIGCIHTAQGLEFDYVGVFIGKDLYFDNNLGRVMIDRNKISKDDKTSGIRTKTTSDDMAEILIKNTYKTLLTRGQKGCYIFCEDDNLRDYFKKIIN